MNEKNIKLLNVCSVVILLLCVAYSFMQVFFDELIYSDPFYFISLYAHDGYKQPFSLLNQGLFVLTDKLFEGYLISYKIVVWFFYALGMILCLLYGYNRTKNRTLLYLGTIVGFLCIPNASFSFAFNGNGLSLLGVVLLLIALDSYTNGSKSALIWIGLLMAFLPLVRFPNIVAFVILLFITPLVCKNWKDYGYIVLSLTGGIALYLIINIAVFGGWTEFANAIKDSYITVSDNTANDHSLPTLISRYLSNLKDGISYYKLLFPLAIVPMLGYFARRKIFSWILAIISTLGLIAFIKFKVNPDQWFFPWFVTCIFMMLCIIVCVFAVIRGDKTLFGWGLLPIGLGLCCCAGSGLKLTLFWRPMCAMAPFILLKMSYILKTTNKDELLWAIISFIGISVCSFLYCRTDTMIIGVVGLLLLIIIVYYFSKRKTFNINNSAFDNRNAFIPIYSTLATIILCSSTLLIIANKIERENHPLHTYSTFANEPKLKGIRIIQEQKIWIQDVMHRYRILDDSQNVVFYGFVSDIFPYLADIKPIRGVDFSWIENESNLSAFIKATETNPVVFLCPCGPENIGYNLDSYPKINEYLSGKGYTKTVHGNYAIYYPSNVQ